MQAHEGRRSCSGCRHADKPVVIVEAKLCGRKRPLAMHLVPFDTCGCDPCQCDPCRCKYQPAFKRYLHDFKRGGRFLAFLRWIRFDWVWVLVQTFVWGYIGLGSFWPAVIIGAVQVVGSVLMVATVYCSVLGAHNSNDRLLAAIRTDDAEVDRRHLVLKHSLAKVLFDHVCRLATICSVETPDRVFYNAERDRFHDELAERWLPPTQSSSDGVVTWAQVANGDLRRVQREGLRNAPTPVRDLAQELAEPTRYDAEVDFVVRAVERWSIGLWPESAERPDFHQRIEREDLWAEHIAFGDYAMDNPYRSSARSRQASAASGGIALQQTKSRLSIGKRSEGGDHGKRRAGSTASRDTPVTPDRRPLGGPIIPTTDSTNDTLVNDNSSSLGSPVASTSGSPGSPASPTKSRHRFNPSSSLTGIARILQGEQSPPSEKKKGKAKAADQSEEEDPPREG